VAFGRIVVLLKGGEADVHGLVAEEQPCFRFGSDAYPRPFLNRGNFLGLVARKPASLVAASGTSPEYAKG
jgi:hypothetical protein